MTNTHNKDDKNTKNAAKTMKSHPSAEARSKAASTMGSKGGAHSHSNSSHKSK